MESEDQLELRWDPLLSSPSQEPSQKYLEVWGPDEISSSIPFPNQVEARKVLTPEAHLMLIEQDLELIDLRFNSDEQQNARRLKEVRDLVTGMEKTFHSRIFMLETLIAEMRQLLLDEFGKKILLLPEKSEEEHLLESRK